MHSDSRKRKARTASLRLSFPPDEEVEPGNNNSAAMSPSPKKQKIDSPSSRTRSRNDEASTGTSDRASTPTSSNISPSRRGRGRPKGSRSGVGLEHASETSVLGKNSPIKTRRILKAVSSASHCTLCKKPKKDGLKSCSKCKLNYHLVVCLKYSPEMSYLANNMDDWLCPKCIRCSACFGFIDDVHNKECVQCLHAWHGRCFKGSITDHGAFCKKCRSVSPAKNHHSPIVSASSISSEQLSALSRKGPGRPRKKLFIIDDARAMIDRNLSFPSCSHTDSNADEDVLTERERIYDIHIDEFNRTKPTRHSWQEQEKSSNSKNKGRQRRTIMPLATEDDLNLFNEVLAQYAEEKEEKPLLEKETKGKWVYLGRAPKMKALYDSPYTDDVLSSEAIYICAFCLYSTGDTDVYRIHQKTCTWRHPPGNEIYRDKGLSFFEVEGATQPTYCRNLCLLAKMFISSKTLHHEVATFRFYVLTEHTSYGCRLVGYFSKEENPNRNNNLSCLLTLPGESRRGFGKLLIDLSYELSRRERKIGSPEHPLSDLGLYAYRAYWRSRILQYLRSTRNTSHISVKQMALDTRISPTDIVNQLMLDELLGYSDGNYYIKTGKRAFKFPLSLIRRRGIDPERLIWSPHTDVSHLDPTRLNYYA